MSEKVEDDPIPVKDQAGNHPNIVETFTYEDQAKGNLIRFYQDPNKRGGLAGLKTLIGAQVKKDVAIESLNHQSIEQKKEKEPNPYFEFIFCLFLELIALFDMGGDIYLLI